MNAGIDWGRFPMANGRLPNRDETTGIRYGVIACHKVDGWAEGAEPQYGEPACPRCGSDVFTFLARKGSKLRNWLANHANDLYCKHCQRCCSDDAAAPDEADGYLVEEDGLHAHSSGDSPYIFVTLSPYYTLGRYCSPCMPGAVDLDSPDSEGERAYCFGHEWFDGGKAPYPVYRVDTGEEVLSDEDVQA